MCLISNILQNKNDKMNTDKYNEPSDIWPTNKDNQGDYYYKTSLCSFPGYITRNAGSHFITDKESVGFIVMENSIWAATTASGLNDEHHPIPRKLYVAWYSPHEDSFYEGLFDLPYDELKQDFEKIWKDYPNKSLYTADKFDRFRDFIVGVAPKGDVVVWLGSKTQTKIIGTFKAKVTDKISWESFASMNSMGAGATREHYIKTSKKGADPLPYDKVEQYNQRYNWKPNIENEEGINLKIDLNLFYIMYFNGEEETIYSSYHKTNDFKLRGVPSKINFEFYMDGTEYSGGVDFYEEDAYEAFKKMKQKDNDSLHLVITLDKDKKISKTILKNKHSSYVFDMKKHSIGSTPIDKSLDIKPLEN